MSMNAPAARLLLVICLGMLSACSREARPGTEHANQGAATRASTTRDRGASADSSAYPYDLWIGASVNHVEQEAEAGRLRVELVRWSASPYTLTPDAVFRVTNPGNRPVLVWNVRQQVSVPRSDWAARVWETQQSDYPGRGWEHVVIPTGGSVQFPMLSPTEGDWRVCLLYSREMPDSQAPNRRFDGTYESISPSVREEVEPEAQAGAASNRGPAARSGDSGAAEGRPR